MKLLTANTYDAAIVDIMGVKGLALLKVAAARGIPMLMLTAHALNADTLVRSVRSVRLFAQGRDGGYRNLPGRPAGGSPGVPP